jgi:alpha-beta hydrolase superfamily lysophospholipase
LVYHGPFHRSTLLALAGSAETVATGGSLAELPTLWIHGANDQLVPYELTAEAIERIKGTSLRQTAYDGAAHEVFNETNSDEVLAEVAGFLTEVLALD